MMGREAALGLAGWAWAAAFEHAYRLAVRNQLRYRVVKIGPYWYITEGSDK